MKQTRLVLFIILLSACGQNREPGILIEGHVAGIPDGMIYLSASKSWKTPLDSVLCKNGHFRFRLSADSTFVPFLAELHYWIKTDRAKPFRLQFRNHTLPDSLHSLRDVFWLEPGKITLEGNNQASPWVRIHAGKDNDLLFRNQYADIAWMGEKDRTARRAKMNRLISLVKEYPRSAYLLKIIYDSKELYSKEELLWLTGVFDPRIWQTRPGIIFREYLLRRPDTGAPYPGLAFPEANGNLRSVFDTSARLNMLVFWASWCGPCIREIPHLKDIYREFSGKGLNLVSISVDQDPVSWKRSLPRHNMPWPQLRVPYDQINKTEELFSFTSIPYVIITDRSRRELARIDGFDPGIRERVQSMLRDGPP